MIFNQINHKYLYKILDEFNQRTDEVSYTNQFNYVADQSVQDRHKKKEAP